MSLPADELETLVRTGELQALFDALIAVPWEARGTLEPTARRLRREVLAEEPTWDHEFTPGWQERQALCLAQREAWLPVLERAELAWSACARWPARELPREPPVPPSLERAEDFSEGLADTMVALDLPGSPRSPRAVFPAACTRSGRSGPVASRPSPTFAS